MDAILFNFAADRLECHSPLDRMEARGTLRIALKASGLEPKRVTPSQLCVVLMNVMPRELETRGVGDPTAACNAVIEDLTRSWVFPEIVSSSDPYEVFRRLSGA